MPPPPEQQIDAAAWRERIERMSELFGSMIVVADDLSTRRCPYKNRLDQCTAQFGCRNQRRIREEHPEDGRGIVRCGGDDKLDYRHAWDVEAPA